MNSSSLEEVLERDGRLTYTNVGVSMLPLLRQGRDVFTIERKTDARCKKYDVALYRREPHVYVLHRIVEVREHDYVFLGDNCINREYGITDGDILGVMTSFSHKGRTYGVDDIRYRMYVWLWSRTTGLRIRIKKTLRKLWSRNAWLHGPVKRILGRQR